LPYEWPGEHYKTIKEMYSKSHDTDNEFNEIVKGAMLKYRNSDFEEISLENAEGDEGIYIYIYIYIFLYICMYLYIYMYIYI
jgi:hypothetical protein